MSYSRRTPRPASGSSTFWPKVENERDLKLGAKVKLAVLEKRASLDATVVAPLRKERDEQL